MHRPYTPVSHRIYPIQLFWFHPDTPLRAVHAPPLHPVSHRISPIQLFWFHPDMPLRAVHAPPVRAH